MRRATVENDARLTRLLDAAFDWAVLKHQEDQMAGPHQTPRVVRDAEKKLRNAITAYRGEDV